MKKKLPKKFKDIIFIEDCGTYRNEIIVVIGANFDKVLEYVKRRTDITKENLKEFEEGRAEFLDAEKKEHQGFVLHYKKGFQLMWIKAFFDSWEWYDTLIHECCHATHYILEVKGIRDEEAFAYLQEHLIRKIRRRLTRIYKL